MKKIPRISFNLSCQRWRQITDLQGRSLRSMAGQTERSGVQTRRCFLFSEGNGLAGAGTVEAVGDSTPADA